MEDKIKIIFITDDKKNDVPDTSWKFEKICGTQEEKQAFIEKLRLGHQPRLITEYSED